MQKIYGHVPQSFNDWCSKLVGISSIESANNSLYIFAIVLSIYTKLLYTNVQGIHARELLKYQQEAYVTDHIALTRLSDMAFLSCLLSILPIDKRDLVQMFTQSPCSLKS